MAEFKRQAVTFDQMFDLTRATPKWVFDATGTLVEVPANEPAYQYDPVTGKALGLLIEEQRTNLLLRSADLTYPSWAGTNLSKVSPTRVEETADDSSAVHHLRQAIGKEEYAYTYTYTVVTRGGERNIRLSLSDSGTANRALWAVDPRTGETVETASEAGSFSLVGTRSRVFPNGDIEFSLSAKTGVESTIAAQIVLYAGDIASYIGDGTSGVNIVYQQLEEGSATSSYIKTEGTQVTRAADNCSRTLGAEFNASEGCFIVSGNVTEPNDILTAGDLTIGGLGNHTWVRNYTGDINATGLTLGKGTFKDVRYIPRVLSADEVSKVTGTYGSPLGPGPQTLIAGDMDGGFFGEVSADELFRGDELALMVGVTEGIAQNSTGGWLKFAHNNKIKYIAKQTFRHSISWDYLYSRGIVYGTDDDGVAPRGTATNQFTTVKKDGSQFVVRLMTCTNSDPFAESDPLFFTADMYQMDFGGGSEWNELIYRVRVEVPSDPLTDGMSAERHGGPQVGANWATYTASELNITVGNGRYIWGQEHSDATSAYRAHRGGRDLAHFYRDGGSYADSALGWRPCLELIPNN